MTPGNTNLNKMIYDFFEIRSIFCADSMYNFDESGLRSNPKITIRKFVQTLN